MTIDTDKKSEQQETPSPSGEASQFWCNFCDFRSNNLQEYLSHSCKDVLANKGVEVKPTGRNECS